MNILMMVTSKIMLASLLIMAQKIEHQLDGYNNTSDIEDDKKSGKTQNEKPGNVSAKINFQLKKTTYQNIAKHNLLESTRL